MRHKPILLCCGLMNSKSWIVCDCVWFPKLQTAVIPLNDMVTCSSGCWSGRLTEFSSIWLVGGVNFPVRWPGSKSQLQISLIFFVTPLCLCCVTVSPIKHLSPFFFFSQGLSARKECSADRNRDPWPLPQIPWNLPESANPAWTRGSPQNLWWVMVSSFRWSFKSEMSSLRGWYEGHHVRFYSRSSVCFVCYYHLYHLVSVDSACETSYTQQQSTF